MDTTSLIEIVIVVVAIYFFIRFIVSPIIKAVLGVVALIVIVYLLQRFLGFDIGKVLAPFGISFDSSNWGQNLNWILGPLGYYVDQAKNFLNFILKLLKK